MVYSLLYRRPSRVASEDGSFDGQEKQGSIESCSSTSTQGIPEALSFDRIMAGGTCPPVTVRDFLNYLKYIEHSAENLQFFLWHRDYQARWEQLPASERALAPQWTKSQIEVDPSKRESQKPQPGTVFHSREVSDILKNTDFADSDAKLNIIETVQADPFDTPPKSPSATNLDTPINKRQSYISAVSNNGTFQSSNARTSGTHRTVADQAFDDAGMKWKPFTTLPYRDEVDRIISTYLAENAPRELNLSGRERATLLHALQNTTHPSAFSAIAKTVEMSLRRQAHPNFIRWSICNGNRPRVVFARGLGIAGIIVGFVADLIITLSSASRPWRILPFLGWFIGIATLIAAWKGMCVVLHGLHHRHVRPWELFVDETDEVVDEKGMSQTSFQSDTTNSYEDEPWVARYRKRNIIRKIFDRELWVQEPALRQIQDTIFLQAIIGSFLLSCLFVGIFCAVPRGNFF